MSLDDLLSLENGYSTDMGKAFLSERVVLRGKDLHRELGHKDWFSLFLFAITGRELSEDQLRFLNYIWVCTSYPDPGIWPNQAAALGASARTTPSLALMAGLAISEASIYGRRPERKALDFFYRGVAALESGQTIDQIVDREIETRGILFGYGRPLAKVDERLLHTYDLAKKLGMENGKHLKFAIAVGDYLSETRNLLMNVAAMNTAVVADIGLSPEEYQLYLTAVFITGMAPSYLDSKRRTPGGLFPTRCTAVEYSGAPSRNW